MTANENKPESWRAFIALEIPETVRRAIEQAQSACRDRLAQGCMRWTRPEQFHVTLQFLGNVEMTRVPALTSKLSEVCRNFRTLWLRCARVGSFPERGRPRVVWVGVEDKEGQLGHLYQSVAEATREFAAEEPEKNFAGHITLGRCKEIRSREAAALKQFLKDFSRTEFGNWTASELLLMRSELSPAGARHSVIERLSLAS